MKKTKRNIIWKDIPGYEGLYKINNIGKITKELNGTKDFPEQWGINWYSGKDGKQHAKHVQNFGLLSYWNDKEKIICL